MPSDTKNIEIKNLNYKKKQYVRNVKKYGNV
jgi:hypothetical protein